MPNEYELLPTDSAREDFLESGQIRRKRRSFPPSRLDLQSLIQRLRPVHLVFLAPGFLTLVVVLDHLSGTSHFWRYFSGTASFTDSSLRYEDGLAYYSAEGWSGEHPILEMIERGRQRAESMQVKRQSIESVEDAVEDYKRAFGMTPPEGFEAWYDFAASHNSTTVPSLLPFSHTSVLPYLSMPPALLQSRAIEMQQERGVFGMTFYPDAANVTERMTYANEDDVVGYMSPRWDYPILLEPIVHLLPPNQQPETPMQISACVKDGSCRLSHGDLMERSRELARKGLVWDENELVALETEYRENDQLGWMQTCPQSTTPAAPTTAAGGSEISFIDDFLEYMDFCRHPELTKINGEMIMEEQHVMRPLAPMLAVSRLMHGADMMGVPTRAVNDTHDFEPWSEKNRSQVVWRGTITGVFHRDRWDWRSSQRDRLSRFASTGQDEEKDEEKVRVMVEELTGGSKAEVGLEMREYRRADLVERWTDVGVIDHDIGNMCGIGPTGEACRLDGKHEVPCMVDHACDEMKKEIEFKGSMTNFEALPYKYRLDIDGYGWSSRFRKLMSSNSLIIKSTVYPEWWSAQAIPWYHFIPMKYDYTDLFDILSFFDGPPDDTPTGRLHASKRDKLAETIAENGRKLSLERLRWVDMQSYMLLFLLEYRRAWSLDREAATYQE